MIVALTPLAGDARLPLLIVGPSLGTSAAALWGPVAERLRDDFHVVGWDLPGHGGNGFVPADPRSLTVAGLAHGVLAAADRIAPGAAFAYAGDSVGGAVGLHLLLDAPDRVTRAALVCTGARIGEPDAWAERAAVVLAGGTEAVLAQSRQRWFAPGFAEREPAVAAALLDSLVRADRAGYAAVCHALAGFDVRDRLGEIVAPVLAIAGERDVPTPPDGLRRIAEGVRNGRLEVLADTGHLAPAEAPDRVADLIRSHEAPGG